MVKLLEERGLPGVTTPNGDLFTESARYPYYRLGVSWNNGCKNTFLLFQATGVLE
jgi:hypothetical protein